MKRELQFPSSNIGMSVVGRGGSMSEIMLARKKGEAPVAEKRA